jgi:hypothetical protein
MKASSEELVAFWRLVESYTLLGERDSVPPIKYNPPSIQAFALSLRNSFIGLWKYVSKHGLGPGISSNTLGFPMLCIERSREEIRRKAA